MPTSTPGGDTLKTMKLPSGGAVSLSEHDAGGVSADIVWHCMADPPCNWKKAWNGTEHPEQRDAIRMQIVADWTEHVRHEHER